MSIELQTDPDLDLHIELSTTFLQQVVGVVAQHVGDDRVVGEICVRICGAAESRDLNAQYRGKDSPTNVLSFPAEIAVPECVLLGDLAICWPVVLDEAQQQQKAPRDHFVHLFVHGVLHLLGMDHEEESEAQTMEALEVRILSQLGIADPY